MRHHTLLLCAAVLTLLPLGCEGCANTLQRPDGWSEATHGKDTSPNYALLFDTSRVHEIKITIAASDFQSMQEDLASLVGGTTPARPSTPPPQVLEACVGAANGDACSFVIEGQPMSGACQTAPDGQLACTPQEGAPDEPPAMDLVKDDPIYVPVRIEHEGHVWTHVGMRYKGNSSLSTSFQHGIGKLPFRLHFDKYEDAYAEIDDQRFYGFKKLTFSSNWADDSQIRECFVKEVFRDRGVPAPRCAFYRVVVDTGEGATYWGLYSAVEDPSDGAMLADQLGGRGGNLYKPDGPGATFIQFVQESFVKKTNESAADWSDVQRAIDALHADGLDAAGWRAGRVGGGVRRGAVSAVACRQHGDCQLGRLREWCPQLLPVWESGGRGAIVVGSLGPQPCDDVGSSWRRSRRAGTCADGIADSRRRDLSYPGRCRVAVDQPSAGGSGLHRHLPPARSRGDAGTR